MSAFGAARARAASGLPDDIAFLVGLVPAGQLQAAAGAASRSGACAHEILIARGQVSPAAYYAALAGAAGARFAPHVALSTPVDPFAGRPPAAAARLGLMVVASGGGLRIAAAPRGRTVAALLALLRRNRAAARRVLVTTPQALSDAILACGGGRLLDDARAGNGCLPPERSAALLDLRGKGPAVGALAATAVAGIALLPAGMLSLMAGIGALLFLAVTAMRLLAVAMAGLPAPRAPYADLTDAQLPVYTVLVPLYREVAVLDDLVAALLALDYPCERLDIKLIVEADDPGTSAGLKSRALPGHFEIVTVPAGTPRTKPKALNVGLTFARGALLTIYDAEDQPEPDQLLKAAGRFAAAPPDVACLQASLAWFNWRESWFTRQFAIEYAALFDVLLPALARLGLPLPLGGTSNHFRTGALRAVGAWDAYNVTEDADLGLRLARCGYRCEVLDSTTWEEAPIRLRPWFRQRTRWMKGWMQTYAVHMRRPAALYRELGPARFLAMQALFGGVVASALVHPVAAAFILGRTVVGDIFQAQDAIGAVAGVMCAACLTAGYVGGFAIGLAGLSRRPRMAGLAADLAALPLYWLLMSLAAWRALWQLGRDPHLWEKTEHGLTRFAAAPRAGAVARRGHARAETSGR